MNFKKNHNPQSGVGSIFYVHVQVQAISLERNFCVSGLSEVCIAFYFLEVLRNIDIFFKFKSVFQKC